MKELLHELFEYKDGELIRKVSVGPRGQIGDSAGTPSKGRVQIIVEGKCYYRYRLIWVWHYGDIPAGLQVDHIDNTGLKSDDRIENLRLATQTQNLHNIEARGHCWNKRNGKWEASICHQSKKMHLGLFDCQLDARAEYLRAKRKIAGEFNPYVT